MRKLFAILGSLALVILVASPVLAIALPDGETRRATFVTVTSASLNAYLVDDGGEPCEVQFQYYYGAGTWTDNQTGFVAGYETDDDISVDVTGLTTGELYHCRAQFKNTAGTFDDPNPITFYPYAAPSMPATWFTVDYTKFSHAFFYGLYNYLADKASMPRNTFYLLISLAECIALGIVALIFGKRLMPAVIVLCGFMALFSLVRLLPMFFIVFSIIGIWGMIKMGHPREE
jgi:hypothetical protein